MRAINYKTIFILSLSILIMVHPCLQAMKTNNNMKTEIKYQESTIQINEKPYDCSLEGDQIDQMSSHYCGWGAGILSPGKLAQSFKPSFPVLTRITLPSWEPINNNKGVEITIRESLNGRVLARATSYDFDDDVDPVEFDIPDISVVPDRTYYIVWQQIGGNEGDFVYWGYGGDNSYQKGQAYAFDGITWNEFTQDNCPNPTDFCFVTYGFPSANPIPSFTYSPEEPGPDELITFDASASFDPNGEITEYLWDFDDGTTKSGITTTHEYSMWRTYDVLLTVIDDEDNSNSIKKTIHLKDTIPPNVEILSPESNSLYLFGFKISFMSNIIIGPITIQIQASDSESGMKYVELNIGNDDQRIWDEPYEYVWDDSFFGRTTIEAIARDNDGNEAAQTIDVIKLF